MEDDVLKKFLIIVGEERSQKRILSSLDCRVRWHSRILLTFRFFEDMVLLSLQTTNFKI